MNKYLNKEKGLLDFFCPVCGNNKFNRVERNWFEKSIYYLSFQTKNTKKFECDKCQWTVLLDKGKK